MMIGIGPKVYGSTSSIHPVCDLHVKVKDLNVYVKILPLSV